MRNQIRAGLCARREVAIDTARMAVRRQVVPHVPLTARAALSRTCRSPHVPLSSSSSGRASSLPHTVYLWSCARCYTRTGRAVPEGVEEGLGCALTRAYVVYGVVYGASTGAARAGTEPAVPEEVEKSLGGRSVRVQIVHLS
eukprot:2732912-Rhodomonas_salina.1